MTREEKLQIKEKEKQYKELIKKIAKKLGISYKQCDLFFVDKDYFIRIGYSFYLENNSLMYCASIKYLDYDDIQWDILDMSSNKNQPLSLRATGAFSAFGAHLIPPYKYVSLGDNPELVITNILTEIKQMVEDFNEDLDERVLSEVKSDNCTTLEFIAYVHQKEYTKARKLAEDCIAAGDTGQFGNNGKTFFELALEYLDKNNL